jgi:DNA-directed RNA polymerase delta subunit
MSSPSKRDRMRDAAYQLLRDTRKPLHFQEIAGAILPALGLAEEVIPKTVNTALHEDPKFRFSRVGRGTWTLREFIRKV